MARLASGTLYSFSSTTRDSVGRYRPSISARSEHFWLITGEVVNPVVLESFVVEHPMVHSAIMFGHARYNAGILVELEDRFKIDTSEPKQVEEMKNKLQVVIDRMNMSAPQHARVQKEMILFASPAKPFIYTRLSSARVNRQYTLDAYNDEINALYNSIARATLIALKPPKIWNPENALVYVRGVVFAVLDKEIDDDDDLFDHGTDSVQATRIRVILFHALQSTAKMDTRSFSGNVVYQNPTITSLATFAARTAQTCFRHRTESSQIRSLEMTHMVRYYTTSFPQHRPSMPPPSEDVVLITGTTGLFGLNLLAELLHDVKVTKIYALNRRKSRPGAVAERHASLLHASGLDPALVRHPKLILLEADASRARLGLPQDVYEEMRSSVTHVMHNAWPSTNKDDKPPGVLDGSTYHTLRNLVDVALSSSLPSPPRFLFISSTETVRDPEPRSPSRSSSTTAASSGPAGDAYAESKWIGEQILAAAASSTPLRPIVARLGPLCAAPNGRWRDTSYLPTIVHLGKALGTLPRINEVVRWLPVPAAARAVADMRNASTPVCHVTHPQPVSSLSLLHLISTELRLPIVPLAHWTAELGARVRATAPSADGSGHDPALALLRHIWRAQDPTAIDAPTQIFGHVTESVDGDGSVDAPPLGIADVKLWIQHWKETGMV